MDIRLATLVDAPQISAIYRPYVEGSFISFETEAPSDAEMAERMRKVTTRLPWLVCEEAGRMLGYAYASRHHERAAYQWSVDVSIYLHRDHHRRGLGRALYAELFELLILQGYYTAYAGITLPNDASIGLHESFGFEPV